MRQHAAEFRSHGIPYVFDPGQGLPLFSGDELTEMIEGAAVVTVNDYEAQLLCERTGLSEDAIARRVEALVVTLGGEGRVSAPAARRLAIPPVKPTELVDPTGCGDAYRAGLLCGMVHGWDGRRAGVSHRSWAR